VPVHVNLEKRLRKASITGAIGTKLRRKEFALRKDAMKLMKDGCCSSLHLVFIIQTPALLPAFTSIKNDTTIPLQNSLRYTLRKW
jgi:hypothetical protein